MTNFAVWLKQHAPNDPAAKELQDFAETNLAAWPYQSDVLADYVRAALPQLPSDAERERVLPLLAGQFQEWDEQKQPATTGFWARLLTALAENPGTKLLALFGIIVAGVLAWGIFGDRTFLTSIAQADRARGLITFLFAFSTIGVIILVAVATFWMDVQEVKERFGNAKDLITILIGVLGTILGFYFGSATGDVSRSMFVANVSAPAEPLVKGGKADISGAIVGGVAPYEYDVTFLSPTDAVDDASKLDAKNQKSALGAISQSVTVPDVKTIGSLTFTITARDSAGATATSRGVIFVK